MLRSLLAFFVLAAPAAAAPAQPQEEVQWGLARTPGTCILHAASPRGTMLSIWSFAGQARLGFMIQNRQWESLRDGQRYDLEVDFVGIRAWPVQATARRGIDSDGPGFFFTVQPGGASGGDGFLDAFAAASGMEIRRDGAAFDRLSLAGSREAVSALARCMSDLWQPPATPVHYEKRKQGAALEPAAPV
jgi:hypothetical protein